MKTGVVIEAKTQKYHLRYRDSLTWAARKNRKSETDAEKVIWNELLRRKKMRVKFVRQKPIDRFVLDFYCSELCLAIEIDGGSHNVKKERDILRDKYLKCCGIDTLRIRNDDVLNNLKEVEKTIKTYIESPLALSRERGRDRV
jgi:very-short-patch-repair endonuclease